MVSTNKNGGKRINLALTILTINIFNNLYAM